MAIPLTATSPSQFAFTGYQEDEVSGLKFAQARFYDANTGRFQSEDNVKGFIESPFTLNHYEYCWGNPVGFVDRDGNFGEWIANAADKVCKAGEVVGDFVNEHKTGVGIALNVAGVVAGVGLTIVAGPVVGGAVSGALMNMGSQVASNGTNINLAEVAVSGAFGAAGGYLGSVTSGVTSIAADTVVDTVADVTKDVVSGRGFDKDILGHKVLENLAFSTVGGGVGKKFEQFIDAKYAKKLAKVEDEFITQEKKNISKAKAICKDMQKEYNQALEDFHWYKFGKSVKQRANALQGAFRHNRNANSLEQEYLAIAAESQKLRKIYNKTIKTLGIIRDKAGDGSDSFISSMLNLRDLFNAINEQEACA